jgi:hypothetical protein
MAVETDFEFCYSWAMVTKKSSSALPVGHDEALVRAVVTLEILAKMTRDLIVTAVQVRGADVSCCEKVLQASSSPHEVAETAGVAAVQHQRPPLKTFCVDKANLRQLACLALHSEST